MAQLNLYLPIRPDEPNSLLLMLEDKERIIQDDALPLLLSDIQSHPELVRAKNLIRILGGNFHVESDVENGTAFIVSLPIKYPQEWTPLQNSQRFCN